MAIEINPSTPSNAVPQINGISVIWLGNWNSSKVYRRNEGVFHPPTGSSYRANKSTSEIPSLTALDWDVLAQSGGGGGTTIDSLNDINDVTITTPLDNNLLAYDTATSNWINQTPSQVNLYNKTEVDTLVNARPDTLIELTDVVITTPLDGQALVYDTATSKWVNETVSGGGGGSGEVNTSSNVGIAGVGIFKQKTGVDFEFKKLNAGSAKVSITDDAANSEVDIDINEANLTLGNIGGTLPITKGGTGSTSASNALTALGAASSSALTSHTSNTSNPHNTTAAQVGNTVAQWNANKLQSFDVASASPTNGQVLTYNTTNARWQPSNPSSGGGTLVQAVYGTTNTAVTVSSGTTTSIGLSATITPTSTSNFLYITGTVANMIKSSTTPFANTWVNLLSIQNVTTGANYSLTEALGRAAEVRWINPVTFNIRVPITSTAAQTFTVFASIQGTNVTFQTGGGSDFLLSNLTIMEIGAASSSSTPVKDINFAYTDVSSRLIYTASVNEIILTVTVVILVPFNGVGASISIGDAGQTDRLGNDTQIYLDQVGEYSINPAYKYTSSTAINLLLNAGAGATQGSGYIIIESK
ncbi:hypothetical protein LC613_28705 [Nostoc sphaeroides CHAB 2801]|uniref:hypothetical protein n=1 Tax=Nostoc sphaeroides TaxID=446679 RepID=UPI000E470CFE|nr:hypothetical protein [Nostoc sphaeroides]MCC5631701.1 hypothetical protein [Nostoc sphaeroides CHAB 2801]